MELKFKSSSVKNSFIGHRQIINKKLFYSTLFVGFGGQHCELFCPSICGEDLVSCVMNKYVPEKKAKKSGAYPNRITSHWKFCGAYQCVL